jgi:hypothetical protein
VNSSGSGQELTGSCENGNELPVSIKWAEFLEQLSDY